MKSRKQRAAGVLMCLALATRADAQGSFVNFETPQTHPIEIATVGDAGYILVCNTPDNSVEIYEAAPPHAFVQRVPVGMGPSSVRWNAELGRFYTCNFDGDSVSVVRLDAVHGGSVNAVPERTESLFVGDEPSDIAFGPTNSVAAVSLSSESAAVLLNALTLAPAGGKLTLEVAHVPSGLQLAVKSPRYIAWLPDNRFFAANMRGGSPDPAVNIQYDVGLYRVDSMANPSQADFASGLGSTNHAFAITSDGTRLFMVGTRAQNHTAAGVAAVGALATGFVQSWLMVVDIPAGGPMNVAAEAPVGTPAPLLRSINLNRDYSAGTLTEVATAQALVQPTGITLIENEAGEVTRIVLTGYHSDRVAVLTPDTTVAGGYAIQRVDIPVLNPAASYSIAGPRGVVHSTSTGLVYVNNRLDNTLCVIDPVAGAIQAHFPLQNDPTPAVIRDGREFLYSSRFSVDDSQPVPSGGFVSCAVCHVDGRMDGIPWDLGGLVAGPAIPAEFHDQNGQDTSSMPLFPEEKGPMMTQTLQGLVNYPLNEAFQAVATNAPYHWRGDKANFTDFNEAFVNLQGMDDVGGDPADPKGISDAEMVAYRRFINTIRHPANPEQNLFRVTPGTLGTDPGDPLAASGAKLGMMLYHNASTVGVRSCVDCHHLPDGSSNTSTLTFLVGKTLSGGAAQLHPLETAALRNIAQREMALHSDFTDDITHFTGNNGLLHPGAFTFLQSFTINTFITFSFPSGMPGPTQADVDTQLQALVEFTRQFDTGMAPLSGFAYTLNPNLSPLDSGLNKTALDEFRKQVDDANIGLAAYTRGAGVEKGYWYDLTASPPGWREEGTTNLLTRAQLLALSTGAGNVVILQGTPLGTERRWASPNGTASILTGNTPANLTLEAMAPNTAYVDVSLFDQNLKLGSPPDSSIWTQRTLQSSVVGPTYGVPAVRHEPPRRFRITGDNIRPGATLLFAMASGANPASFPVRIMEMGLYPTEYTSDGGQVWETELELDPTQTFALLNGGYWAPDVVNVLFRLTPAPNLMPSSWNQFLIAVRNEDGTLGFDLSNWQVLTIQDGR